MLGQRTRQESDSANAKHHYALIGTELCSSRGVEEDGEGFSEGREFEGDAVGDARKFRRAKQFEGRE